ncbi:tetratricopeptide repeat protein [Peptococcaceae bacterium]|nr:tetratricopeptide repeat protein [Peptococcaceae bacterium]
MFLNRKRLKKHTRWGLILLVSVIIVSLIATPVLVGFLSTPGTTEAIHSNENLPKNNIEELEKQREKLEKYVAELEAKLENNPKDIDVLLQLASVYTYMRENEKAIEAYLKILEIQPDNINALFSLSYLYFSEQKYDLAEEYIKKVLSKQPENIGALYLYSRVLAEAKEDYELAIKKMEKLIDILPCEESKKYFNEIIEQWKTKINEQGDKLKN